MRAEPQTDDEEARAELERILATPPPADPRARHALIAIASFLALLGAEIAALGESSATTTGGDSPRSSPAASRRTAW